MPVLPTVTIGDATATGTVDQVVIPVTVDPGTTTGTYAVEVSSAAAAELLTSGAGWTCVDTTTDPKVPTFTCTLAPAAPGMPRLAQGSAALPTLTLTITSNQAGPVDITVLVDGVEKASAHAALPESAPVVTVTQEQLAAGQTQFRTELNGRFAALPTFWVWWVDDAGSIGVPTADTTDEWLCRPASSDRPVGVPRRAAKCDFTGDPRTLTTLRYATTETSHHLLHVLLNSGGVIVDTVVEFPAPA